MHLIRIVVATCVACTLGCNLRNAECTYFDQPADQPLTPLARPAQGQTATKHPAPELSAWKGDAPLIVRLFTPGMPPPPCSDRDSGLTLAVWSDGVVLIAADPLRPLRGLRVGQVDPTLVRSALDRVDESGFFWRPQVVPAVDAAYASVRVTRSGTTARHFSDGSTSGDADWWKLVLSALEPLNPECTRPLSEVLQSGEFRGYVAADWGSTPWVK
jgi:hypothetical protein